MTTPCDHRGALASPSPGAFHCTRCGKGLALVDALRALPAPVALRILQQLEDELGPEAVGALETAWPFWRRPMQRFPKRHERQGIVIFKGEYGTGKTRTAQEYIEHLVLVGRALAPRLIAGTGAGVRSLVINRKTGMLAWKKPGVSYVWEPSKGFEGQFTINGTTLDLFSIEAPLTALGEGGDVQLLDDPPKWGPSGKAMLVNALKSGRERGTLTIIPTTDDGLALIGEVLGVQLLGPGAEEAAELAGILVIDLGTTDENAGNLDPAYFVNRESMRRAGTWDPIAGTSPWRPVLAAAEWPSRRLAACPPLIELAVSIDPNKGGSSKPCEVGIVGGGRDAGDVLHVRYDRSGVLDGGVDGWPKVAWELAEDLAGEHPRAPFPVFVLESNVGKVYADLLYAEERNRRRSRGEPGVNFRCKVVFVKADTDKCVRAEAPARVAGQGQVRFASGLDVLEGQLRNLTPKGTDSDRADAANHLLTHLGRLADGAEQVERVRVAETTRAAFAGFAESSARLPRVDFDLDRA